MAEPTDDVKRSDLVAGGRGYDLTADGLAALRRVVDACAAERENPVIKTLQQQALARQTGRKGRP